MDYCRLKGNLLTRLKVHSTVPYPVKPLFVGIETSCDETALALIQGTLVRGHIVHSQDHQASGGVVPQHAAREHLVQLPSVLDRLLAQAEVAPNEIHGIGVTAGPGLVGGLIVGLLFAKGLALSLLCPLWPVHHLEAHGLVARMNHTIDFPYLLLLISGGHCLLAIVHGVSQYEVLGQTYDDAAGECLDKVARALGGPYPGGPYVEQQAREGNPYGVPLPVPLAKEKSGNFSFSGLKTACLSWLNRQLPLTEQGRKDLCASLQRVMAESLCQRLAWALEKTSLSFCVVAGGVAANGYFRTRFQETCTLWGALFVAPPPSLCTDNGVMVAWTAYEHYQAGIPSSLHDNAYPHWPLSQLHPARSG